MSPYLRFGILSPRQVYWAARVRYAKAERESSRQAIASFRNQIAWRVGETHFMRHLLAGDPAANNVGWQWSAGTGTDAPPFFGIFNPTLQAKKFDADGCYIRHWLPELREVPDRFIQEPWKLESAQLNYPPPVVDRCNARDRVLAAFQAACPAALEISSD